MNLEAVGSLFARNFEELGELGASLSVWQNGREILSLGGGHRDQSRTEPWTANTRVLVWSATKGIAAASVLHVLQSEAIALSRRVAEFWPEFAAHGKGGVTIAQLLSHQAGLPALSRAVPVTDHEQVAGALAAEVPLWEPGTRHGYHPRTFGFLLDELVRRIVGVPLAHYWRQTFAVPLELDFWIGIDPELAGSVAPVFPARTSPPKQDPFYTAFFSSGSLTARSFASPRGLHSAAAMNTAEARTGAYPGFGGIGTASALAKFYALLANGGALGGRTLFQPETLAAMGTPLVSGEDAVFLMPTAFSAGFMLDPTGPDGLKLRETFGPSAAAFGHPGAGGSVAFADPSRGMGFAYVMNQMEPGVLPNPKSLRLIRALYNREV
jgi:CubicO group peptidase (beta-lactamase class C family)